MDAYDFHNSVGFIVNNTGKMFVKALDSELRQHVGITHGQWKVLVMLSIEDGITQKEIAKGLGLEAATLIPIIDRMEKDGLVLRKVDQDDRRNNKIYRTKRAEELWADIVNCALKIREISVKDIPPNHVKIMRESLEKICTNLQTHFSLNESSPVASIITSTKDSKKSQ